MLNVVQIHNLCQQHIIINMSFQVLLSQNKILAYFTLDVSANVQEQQILQPSIYATMIYHHHYPVVYFDQLFKHFQHCLPPGTKPGNLRIYLDKKQLPAQMPIGLFINDSTVNLKITVELGMCLLDAFKVIKNSWKKAFEVVNPNRKCDYVKSKLSKAELQQKFRLYKQGLSHNLQREGLYEGSNILVKGLFQDMVVERKYSVVDYPTIGDVVKQLFCLSEQQIASPQLQVKSHTLKIDLRISTKLFLDEWSYNDGYCYLQLAVSFD